MLGSNPWSKTKDSRSLMLVRLDDQVGPLGCSVKWEIVGSMCQDQGFDTRSWKGRNDMLDVTDDSHNYGSPDPWSKNRGSTLQIPMLIGRDDPRNHEGQINDPILGVRDTQNWFGSMIKLSQSDVWWFDSHIHALWLGLEAPEVGSVVPK